MTPGGLTGGSEVDLVHIECAVNVRSRSVRTRCRAVSGEPDYRNYYPPLDRLEQCLSFRQRAPRSDELARIRKSWRAAVSETNSRTSLNTSKWTPPRPVERGGRPTVMVLSVVREYRGEEIRVSDCTGVPGPVCDPASKRTGRIVDKIDRRLMMSSSKSMPEDIQYVFPPSWAHAYWLELERPEGTSIPELEVDSSRPEGQDFREYQLSKYEAFPTEGQPPEVLVALLVDRALLIISGPAHDDDLQRVRDLVEQIDALLDEHEVDRQELGLDTTMPLLRGWFEGQWMLRDPCGG